MGGYIIVAGGETLPEGFQGVQASRAELIDCARHFCHRNGYSYTC